MSTASSGLKDNKLMQLMCLPHFKEGAHDEFSENHYARTIDEGFCY